MVNFMVKMKFTTGRAALAGLTAMVVFSAASLPAMANPIITAVFTGDYSAADEAVVNSALNFYQQNMTSTFALTIDFGTQAANTGASSNKYVYNSIAYSSYYKALTANQNSANASAIASLGGASPTNPVNGASGIALTTTLAGMLGLAPQVTATFASCGNLSGSACITINLSALSAGNGGTPGVDLVSLVEHEFNEVLGTSSNLPGGSSATMPATPSAADLFRYSAAGVRSWSTNSSTSAPCSNSTPNAYFSVDGGVTDLSNYNNCSNGGDYGDWANNPTIQVQDAYGNGTSTAFLTLASPEVMLLEAVGYDFAVPEPAAAGLLLTGLVGLGWFRRSRAA